MTTWGRIIPHFDFLIVNYWMITGSHALNQGSTGALKTGESLIND